MYRKTLAVTALVVGSLLVFASVAFAAYTLFGSATLEQESGTDYAVVVPAAGGVDFDDLDGQTINDLHTLQTDLLGACGLGSPRFSIGVGDFNPSNSLTEEYIHIYLGTQPDYTDCDPNNYQTWGNLLDDANPDLRVDTSQVGGTFYDTLANLYANYGTATIQDLILVSDGNSEVRFDNVVINDTTYTFDLEDPEQCKNGGWEALGFSNQGQCVSSIVSNRGGNPADS